jgi:hypothetical protein
MIEEYKNVKIVPNNKKDCILTARKVSRGNYARIQLSKHHLPEKYHKRFDENKAIFKVSIHHVCVRANGCQLMPYQDYYDTVHICGQGRRPMKAVGGTDVCV